MITYVNSSNADKYSVLFSSATQALIKEGVLQSTGEKDDTGLLIAEDPITTIEQYFSYLPDLIQLGASEKSYDMLRSQGRRYTMLPLDEDVLRVDGNSRAITMPASFQANGFAVQGDKYAEIVYFIVDRFYDITDLDTCDIYIQWTNANNESGVSTPWVVDIESQPNKMIIGWALSSDITKYAGTLRFALRFFQWDDKNLSTIKYSWSTLTQTATIKSSLDFIFGNGKYMIEDEINEAVTNRIVNSQTTLAGVAKAERPTYITNLIEYKDLIENKLYKTELPNNTEIYPLEVQARSNDGGIISYYWRFVDHNGNEQTPNLGGADDPTGALVRTEFREVNTDADHIGALRESKKVLYKKKTTAEGEEYFNAEPLPEDDYAAGQATFYERVALCVATRVGSYNAVAVNRLSGKNMAEQKSVICIIPMPTPATIDINLTPREILGINVVTEDTNASSVTLSVEVSNPEANGTKEGELIYVWYKRAIDPTTGNESTGNKVNYELDEDGVEHTIEDADWIRIEGAGEASLTLTNTAELMAAPKGVEGKYMVVVYNHKNLKYVKTGSSECRVSYAAVKPVIEYPHKDTDETKVDFSNGTALTTQIHVTLEENWKNTWNISDEVTYQWYQTTDDIAVIEGDTALEGETKSTFVPTKTGKYYCQLTNHKNETTDSVVSEIFYVV
jgi:hypothetical protein